jgi:phosphinothricin acetyltransferase
MIGGMLDVRLADPDRDAVAVAAIYRAAVESTIASFEEVAPDAGEMRARMRTVLERLPWLVAVADGRVIGYAYAAPHKTRAGYRWSADISVYVDPAQHGRGVGHVLYDRLLDLVRRQGYVNLYAGIALPNPASVRLHEAIGMRRIAVYERVGWKFGAWRDVVWFGMRLSEPDGQPAEPLTVREVLARDTR